MGLDLESKRLVNYPKIFCYIIDYFNPDPGFLFLGWIKKSDMLYDI